MLFEPGTKVDLMRGGQWEGPFIVTDMVGRTPEHLVLRNPANGVLFEEHADEYSVPYHIRPVPPAVQVTELEDSRFNKHMRRGHELRTGHVLDAVMISTDGELWHQVNKCCGESIPTA